MTKRDRIPPALKHGGYSGTGLITGEDPAAFEKLHGNLIDEFAPAGCIEEDIVKTIAHVIWRKHNISNYVARQPETGILRLRAPVDDLLAEWSVIDRLDAIVDRCIKRLLMVRGVKSMSMTSPSASSNQNREPATSGALTVKAR